VAVTEAQRAAIDAYAAEVAARRPPMSDAVREQLRRALLRATDAPYGPLEDGELTAAAS